MKPDLMDPVLSAMIATAAGPMKLDDLSVMLYSAKNLASSCSGMSLAKHAREYDCRAPYSAPALHHQFRYRAIDADCRAYRSSSIEAVVPMICEEQRDRTEVSIRKND
jgi:hypothetical protein